MSNKVPDESLVEKAKHELKPQRTLTFKPYKRSEFIVPKHFWIKMWFGTSSLLVGVFSCGFALVVFIGDLIYWIDQGELLISAKKYLFAFTYGAFIGLCWGAVLVLLKWFKSGDS